VCSTFNDDVARLVVLSLKQPVRLAADAAAAAPSTLSQEVNLRLAAIVVFIKL
jgi:ATP-dependent RNA helicase DDX27